MTRREKQLVRDSFEAIREDAGALSLLFYGRLFELEPRARAMFHGNIERQGLKLMQMIEAVVSGLDRFDDLQPTLFALGQRHVAYGVQNAHYELVTEALVWSLRQALALPTSSEVLKAWQSMLGQVSAAMIAGAAEIEAPRPLATQGAHPIQNVTEQ